MCQSITFLLLYLTKKWRNHILNNKDGQHEKEVQNNFIYINN